MDRKLLARPGSQPKGLTSNVAFPGHRTPAAGWDEPFAMLEACHERVRRMLALLRRLHEHLLQQGCDHAVRSAAGDVLRYFDEAAPRHHEDEERHLLPRLTASGQAERVALAARLHREHLALQATWSELRSFVLQVAARAEDTEPDDLPPAWRQPELSKAIDDYIRLYLEHAQTEDEYVFPWIAQQLDTETLAAMGAEMASRRGL